MIGFHRVLIGTATIFFLMLAVLKTGWRNMASSK